VGDASFNRGGDHRCHFGTVVYLGSPPHRRRFHSAVFHRRAFCACDQSDGKPQRRRFVLSADDFSWLLSVVLSLGPGIDRPVTATLFLLCWVGVQVGAFTIAKTKLPSYVTPCYPALALLAASCLVDFARQLKPNFAANADGTTQPRVARLWFYAAFAGLGIGGVLISIGVWVGVGEYLPSLRWLAGLGLIPVMASGWLLWELRRQRSQRVVAIYCIGAMALAIAAFDFGVLAIDSERSCMTVLQEAQQRSGPVATYGCHESTWVFYCQKPIVELHVETGPVQTFASGPVKNKPPRKFWKQVPWQRLHQFVANNKDPLIITNSEKADDLLRRLPDGFGLICDTDYFVAKSVEEKKLCLIGRVAK